MKIDMVNSRKGRSVDFPESTFPGRGSPSGGGWRFFLNSIRTRLLALVLLALLPTLALVLYTAREYRNQATEDIRDHTLRLSRFLASNLERDIDASYAFLLVLSGKNRDALSRFDPAAACAEILSAFPQRTGIFDLVGVADPMGHILCDSRGLNESGRLDSLAWFRTAIRERKFTVGYDLQHVLTNRVTMDFGLPVQDGQGPVQAFFYCAADMDWLNDLAGNSQLPKGATLMISDSNGRALIRYPNPELWVGKISPDAAFLHSNLSQREGMLEGPGLDGIVRLHAFTRVDHSDFTIRIGIPRESAYAAAQRAMIRNLIGLGIAAAVAMLAAWAAGHWMVARQVDKLVMATKELASGNLAGRTEMGYGAGELGQLARAFDDMAESLEWREAQLRESEIERTISEERFTEMVDMAPEAILGLDEDQSIFFFNRSAEKMFGFQRSEVEGLPFSILEKKRHADPDRTTGPLDASPFSASGANPTAPWNAEGVFFRKSGEAFRAELSFSRAAHDGRACYTCIVREKKAA